MVVSPLRELEELNNNKTTRKEKDVYCFPFSSFKTCRASYGLASRRINDRQTTVNNMRVRFSLPREGALEENVALARHSEVAASPLFCLLWFLSLSFSAVNAGRRLFVCWHEIPRRPVIFSNLGDSKRRGQRGNATRCHVFLGRDACAAGAITARAIRSRRPRCAPCGEYGQKNTYNVLLPGATDKCGNLGGTRFDDDHCVIGWWIDVL